VEGGEMNEQLKEKIANILYDGARQGIHPLTVAQQILDLPLSDLKCTVGELIELVKDCPIEYSLSSRRKGTKSK